jgi:peptidyl-prolyl cis-trans isomerase SurA
MKKIFTFFIACSICGALSAQMLIDKIVAQVGGELVLLSELEEQHNLMSAQQGTLPEGFRCTILDGIMTQKLMINQAKLDSIEVTDDEIEAQLDARFERILAYMNNDVTQFEAYYGQTIPEVKAQFREDLKNQLLAERMQGRIMENVTITPAEVKEFFEQIPTDSLPYFNSEVELGEIVYRPKVNEEQKAIALKTLEEVKAKLDAGEDFAVLAQNYSQDGSARSGGDLGWARRGTFVPEFEAAAYNLELSEISDIVESEFGFHIIQLLERRGNSIHTRHILIRPEITDDDLKLARDKLNKIRQEILTDSLIFERAVKLYSDEDQMSFNNGGNMVNPKTNNTFFEIGDLDPDVYFAIDTLEVNGITAPIEMRFPNGEKAFRLVLLKSRTSPHKASLSKDYSKIKKAALEAKKSEFINKWVEEHIVSTFIDVETEFQSCPTMQEWIMAKTRP